MPDQIETYTLTVTQAALAARLLAEVPLDEMLDAIERADALGPLVYPTLWLKKQTAMREDLELLKAARPLWALGRKMRAAAMRPETEGAATR